MAKTFTIESVDKIQRGTALNEILCHIKFKEVRFEVPFWASEISTDPFSKEMYQRLNSGEFGEVGFPPSLYRTIPPTQAEVTEDVRTKRDSLLLKSDWTQTTDCMLPTSKKEEWKVYRQKLRDLPSQIGFPYDVDWPTQP
jgi:hypothetical protein